jgi:hypothetical protein
MRKVLNLKTMGVMAGVPAFALSPHGASEYSIDWGYSTINPGFSQITNSISIA